MILECYNNCTAHMSTGPVLGWFKDDNGPYSKFITLAGVIILKERDVIKPGPFATVLDSVNGREDRCKPIKLRNKFNCTNCCPGRLSLSNEICGSQFMEQVKYVSLI
jgi:hypothetical protein